MTEFFNVTNLTTIFMRILLIVLVAMSLNGCMGIPEGVKPVKDFQIDRYMGKWFEVARLDHSFERGLERVTATYTPRDDGGVSVLNRGYSVEEKEWSEAEGKAYFVNDETEGYLKVSFFGPFYGSYIIFELERENYDYAFVSGPDLSYLWLLSRTPNPSQTVIDNFIKMAKELGFDVNHLIFVNQNENT